MSFHRPVILPALPMEVRILMVKDILSASTTGIHERGVRTAKVKEGEATVTRRKALRRLDRELEKGNCKAALSLMKQFKAHPAGLLRGFGAATLQKVPRNVSSFELTGRREISSLQFVIDAILHSLKHSLEFQLQEETQILPQDFGKTMDADSSSSIYEDHLMGVQDSLLTELPRDMLKYSHPRRDFWTGPSSDTSSQASRKSMEALVLMSNDSAPHTRHWVNSPEGHDTTIRRLTKVRYVHEPKKNLISLGTLEANGYKHEAGHFLVGYMLGVLPRRYKVPSVDDLLENKFARGKVEFVGFEFLREVSVDLLSDTNSCKGKLNKETLAKFSRVTLGGLAAEYLLFGCSDLLHSDVQKLNRVFKWLGLTEDEVDFENRHAAEDTVLILSSQNESLSRLAEAMASGRSVGSCIETIEHT